MPVWIIFLGFVVLSLIVLIYLRKSKTGLFENFDGSIQESAEFTGLQNTYFHDVAPANKGLIINPNLATVGLNDSLAQPDMYLPKSPDRDYSTYFEENPEYKYSEKNDMCKQATIPDDLPAHTNEIIGCGWYYVKNPSVPSVGAAGSALGGPLFQDELPPNGQWIWNLKYAQKMEDLKFCSRIKECYLLDNEGIKGRCGFCKAKGTAVPILPNGKEKYPDVNGNFCKSQILTDAAQCVEPPTVVLSTQDGVECGQYGFPSPDKSVRLYNVADCDMLGGVLRDTGECINESGVSFSEECKDLNIPAEVLSSAAAINAENVRECGKFGYPSDDNTIRLYTDEECNKLDGIIAGNGECIRKEGGSYSFICRGLNDPTGTNLGTMGRMRVTQKTDICSPNSSGKLTGPCLISIAKAIGFSKEGALWKIIGGRRVPTAIEKVAIGWLNDYGISLTEASLGEGSIDKISVTSIYNKIYSAMTNGTVRAKASAKYLVNGDPTFDPCRPDLIGRDPIPLVCLQREFRKSGCQASGEAYPSQNTLSQFASQPLNTVTSTFQNLYRSMSDSNLQKQTANVKKCLGINYVSPYEND